MMRALKARWTLVAALVALCTAGPLRAQEEPLMAGSEGVPVPKKTRHVQPVYPAEALAQGIRGIVILEIVIDGQGKVASTSVLRSVPGLDEAAVGAARQWEYQPTSVDGKPVSVRLTVPITFSLALPKLQRQAGVPELRQGATPAYPSGESGGGSAAVEVTLEPDGRIGVATLLSGQPPWSHALLTALKTWRFAAPPDDAIVSFRVEADFVKARGADASVVLRATGLQRSELLADATRTPQLAPAPTPPGSGPLSTAAPPAEPVPGGQPPTAPGVAPPEPSSAPGPRPEPPATTAAAPTAAAAPEPAPEPAAVAAAPSPAAEAAPEAKALPPTLAPAPAPAAQPAAAPAPAASALAAGAAPPSADAGSTGAAAPPPVEVITAPPPAQPAESGISAVRDVTLEPGVPELARGRRPVAPPLARMSATTGTVEVSFSVGAGGTTTLQTAAGSDLLRYAAEQTVATWVFRRTRAERAYLVAVFSYAADKATAVVRPQAAPSPDPPAAAAPTTPPPPGSAPPG